MLSSNESSGRQNQKPTAMSVSVVNGPRNEDVYISAIRLASEGNEK